MNHFDEYLLRHLYGGDAPPALLAFMQAVTVIGEGWIILAFVPVLFWSRPRRLAAYLIGTLLTTGALVFTAKLVIRRLRPYQAVPWVRALVSDPPTDFSCPSGHSAGSFALAVFVLTVVARGDGRSTRAVILASVLVAIALLVAISRVFLGVHYPSDILAGALLGSAIGFGGGELYLASLRRDLAAAKAAGAAARERESAADV
jgi:undecaprenyl-diphosphatase